MEFKQPEPLDLHSDNVAERWRRWRRQFEFYYVACELSKKSPAIQTAILLHAAGPEVQEIYSSFTWDNAGDNDDYAKVLQKLEDYCEPRRNVVFERYQFWSRNQKEQESIDTWMAALRNMAAKCEFGNQNELLLRDKLVFGIRDVAVKERLLREKELPLQKALDISRASESSKQQIRAMTAETMDVLPVGLRRPNKPGGGENNIILNCAYCGGRHARGSCPAYGKQCNKCNGYNHFSTVCKGGGFRRKEYNSQNSKKSSSKPSTSQQKPRAGSSSKFRSNKSKPVNVHTVEYGNNDLLFIGPVTVGESNADRWHEDIVLNGSAVSFKLDTGADANCLPKTLWHKLFPNQMLSEARHMLRAYGGENFKPAGVATVQAECPATGMTLPTKFYVTDADVTPILGRTSCEQFQLVQRLSNAKSVCQLSRDAPLTTKIISTMYQDVFSGLGEYQQPYHITVDASIPPVIQHNRRVPFAKLPALKTALESLEQQGVIAPVDRPTDWVHNLVITEKKSGSLRICLDPKPLNKAIKRERHSIPTVEDVLYRFNGKKIFTVVDMRDSYWHVKLDEPSSYLCTFHTPWGRKRFLRMPFGISSASEIMQKRNEHTFDDISGVHVIADDIIIAANDEREHDSILLKVLQRARECNIKFNLQKLQFKQKEVAYMGHVVTAEGLRACPKKTEAIVNMPCPTDKPSLLRFLGMVKYLAQFVPGESMLTAPLRSLLKKDSQWLWSFEHDKAVANIKQALSKPVLLHFFDVNKPVMIQCDASQSGLGACIIQDNRPVAFASRALTPAECNYSQIEKELLAICFACCKFHPYCYGREVQVQTDHKPLEIIFKKPLAMAAPRLQRMLLQFQRYCLNVNYVPGKYLYVADALSRAYISDSAATGAPEDIEVMVHSLTSSLPISPQKLEAFQKAMAADRDLQHLLSVVRCGWPKSFKSVPASLRPYWNVRDEIHEADGLLFRGNRIIVPASMQPEMLKLIHEGHLGVEKCRSRARQIFYWPKMSQDISDIVARCNVCLTLRASQQKEPLINHEVPERPWQKLAADIMTLNGSDYLVVVDYFSKYPEIAMLQYKTAKHVIMHLKSILARHGVPELLFTDNMPFGSAEFRQFASDWDITLATSSPTYPQSNGQAERAVQTVKNLLHKAIMSGQDPYVALMQYRTTPFSGIPYSPAQMLMGRQLRGKLPISSKLLQPAIVKARPLLVQCQNAQKQQYDKSAKALPPLQPGDSIHVQPGGKWEPGVVIKADKAPRSYIVRCKGSRLRRNRRQLLSTPSVPPPPDQDTILDDYPDDYAVATPAPVPAPAVVPNIPDPQPVIVPAMPQPDPQDVPTTSVVSERPKRKCQPPARYTDFVK